MKILLITQYAEEIVNQKLPENPVLCKHYQRYHLAVYNALLKLNYEVIVKNGMENDIAQHISTCNLVFCIRHDFGFLNSDINIPLLCKKLNKKIVGSAVYAKFYDSDKIVGKILAEKLKIPTSKYDFIYNVNKLKFNPPYLLKPRFSASSADLSDWNICYSLNELLEKIKQVKAEQYFIEQFIQGNTITIGAYYKSNDHSVIIPEPYILNSRVNKVISYLDKKTGGCIKNESTNTKVNKKIKHFAKKYFQFMQPCQLARFDFMLSNSNELYFLEVNTTPNLSDSGGFVKNFTSKHFESYEDFINAIINDALQI